MNKLKKKDILVIVKGMKPLNDDQVFGLAGHFRLLRLWARLAL
jgi:hypothetical protein